MSLVLLVEDNEDLAFGLRNNLEIEGYSVEVFGDGRGALARLRDDALATPDLVVLDLMLPDLDGLQILRDLRGHTITQRVPVLVLTARGEESDVVRGLRLGADDYVLKPFGLLELLARLEALLRRSAANRAPEYARHRRFGSIAVDTAARAVRRSGELVPLTPKEFDLLVALLDRRGAAASRLELIREVWGYSGSVVTRTVDTHVAELRRKLEANPAEPRFILTVPRIGYRLEAGIDDPS